MKNIKVYCRIDRSELYRVGKQAGLDEEGAMYLTYFQEVPIELKVDRHGTVHHATILLSDNNSQEEHL